MVLQQDLKLRVWGFADPGETVTVSVAGNQGMALTSPVGSWQVDLAPLPAGTPPCEMHIEGEANALDFKDVLIGDVWLCAGQSNMEFGLGDTDHAAEAIAGANQPEIRLYLVPRKSSLTPLADCGGKWVVCTPQTVMDGPWKGFSAVSYFFGKEIHENRKVPVGLVATYVGGTRVETWSSLQTLQADPTLQAAIKPVADTVWHVREVRAKFEQDLAEARKAHEEWNAKYGNAYHEAERQWKQAVQEANAAHQSPPLAPLKPPQPEPTESHFFGNDLGFPTALYNAMLHPLISYGIKGAIWYQGESNANNLESAQHYATVFPAMIASWRQEWGQGNFPFLFVQLPGWKTGDPWPELRESQTRSLSVPNTAMAVALDLGLPGNLHPPDKEDVAHRLALLARRAVYKENVVASGPTFAGVKFTGATAQVAFNHRGGGLVTAVSPVVARDGASPEPTDVVAGFEIAGSDGAFVPATAKIDGDGVTLGAAGLAAPAAVRYGWAAFPRVNLYNREGLPAAPFDSRSTPVIP